MELKLEERGFGLGLTDEVSKMIGQYDELYPSEFMWEPTDCVTQIDVKSNNQHVVGIEFTLKSGEKWKLGAEGGQKWSYSENDVKTETIMLMEGEKIVGCSIKLGNYSDD